MFFSKPIKEGQYPCNECQFAYTNKYTSESLIQEKVTSKEEIMDMLQDVRERIVIEKCSRYTRGLIEKIILSYLGL